MVIHENIIWLKKTIPWFFNTYLYLINSKFVPNSRISPQQFHILVAAQINSTEITSNW